TVEALRAAATIVRGDLGEGDSTHLPLPPGRGVGHVPLGDRSTRARRSTPVLVLGPCGEPTRHGTAGRADRPRLLMGGTRCRVGAAPSRRAVHRLLARRR